MGSRWSKYVGILTRCLCVLSSLLVQLCPLLFIQKKCAIYPVDLGMWITEVMHYLVIDVNVGVNRNSSFLPKTVFCHDPICVLYQNVSLERKGLREHTEVSTVFSFSLSLPLPL